MTADTSRRYFLLIAIFFVLKILLGFYFVFKLPPVSIDDYFRIFHARWWWDHKSFTSSFTWLPGHQYVYGVVVGVFNDSLIAPRILTWCFQVATGALFLAGTDGSRTARLIGLGWILFSPLSFLLGAAPLTEALAYFLVAAHWVLALRVTNSKSRWGLWFCSLALLAACAVRYELWLLTIPYVFRFRTTTIVGVSKCVKWAILLMPTIFPVAWILHGAANPDGMFAFLSATKDDHLGQGSFYQTILSPIGAISIIQFLAATTLLVLQRELRTSIAGQYFFVLTAVVLGLVVTDSLPSQLTARIFYGPIVTAGFFVGDGALWRSKLRKPLISGVCVMFGLGAIVVAFTPLGVKKENYELSQWLRGQYDSGRLKDGDHVVVSHVLPDSTAIGVLSNNYERVHIDTIGKNCAIHLLSIYRPTCTIQQWAQDTQLAIVGEPSSEHSYIASLGWLLERSFGNWRVFRRPVDAEFPVMNKPLHPLFQDNND